MQRTFQCIKKNEQMDGLKNNWMHIYSKCKYSKYIVNILNTVKC